MAWFVLLVLIGIILAVGLKNILGGLAVIALAILFVVLSVWEGGGEEIKVKIYREGIKIGQRFWHFSEVLFYRIEQWGDKLILKLRTTARVLPELHLYLPDEETKEKVKAILRRYLPWGSSLS
ncbi:MAG: hypothetical protein J7J32_06040 [Candidatus Atribacteria bacterium]|nr:hypothetical protein [Candidatus Atribacteria bacterium]MCD6349957.1 hypothetical protein [Candidatus Atribacteria bacterium]